MEELRNSYRIVVGRPEGRRWLQRTGRRWEDKIRMGLTVVGWEDVAW